TSLIPPLADQVPSAEVALLVKPKKFIVNDAGGAAGTAPRRIEDAAIRANLDRFFMVLAPRGRRDGGGVSGTVARYFARYFIGRYCAGSGPPSVSASQTICSTYQRPCWRPSWIELMPRWNGCGSAAVFFDA